MRCRTRERSCRRGREERQEETPEGAEERSFRIGEGIRSVCVMRAGEVATHSVGEPIFELDEYWQHAATRKQQQQRLEQVAAQ